MPMKPLHQRRRNRRIGIAAGIVAGGLLGLWALGLVQFAGLIPQRVANTASRTDAIVVLTGGTGRLDEGLALLERNRADKLFVSGVYQGIDVKQLLELFLEEPGRLESRVGIGNAVDTRDNAAETADWVRAEGVGSIRLVTAAYHMPRSLLEFRFALPETEIVPNPVFPEHVKAKWWMWPGTAGLVIKEYNKYLVAVVRQWLAVLFSSPAPPATRTDDR